MSVASDQSLAHLNRCCLLGPRQVALLVLGEDGDQVDRHMLPAEHSYGAVATAFAATFTRERDLAHSTDQRHPCLWAGGNEANQAQAFVITHDGLGTPLELGEFNNGLQGRHARQIYAIDT